MISLCRFLDILLSSYPPICNTVIGPRKRTFTITEAWCLNSWGSSEYAENQRNPDLLPIPPVGTPGTPNGSHISLLVPRSKRPPKSSSKSKKSMFRSKWDFNNPSHTKSRFSLSQTPQKLIRFRLQIWPGIRLPTEYRIPIIPDPRIGNSDTQWWKRGPPEGPETTHKIITFNTWPPIE